MTKEEILENGTETFVSPILAAEQYKRQMLTLDDVKMSVESAMEEYAKQQAIAFVQFCFEQGIISDDFDRKDGIYFDGNHFYDPSFNESGISSYDKFIEQQNKP